MSGFQALFELLEQNMSRAKVAEAAARVFREIEAPTSLEFDYFESVYKPFLEDAKAYAFNVALKDESQQVSAYKNLTVIAKAIFKRCLEGPEAEKAFDDYEESLLLPKLKAATFHRRPADEKRLESVALVLKQVYGSDDVEEASLPSAVKAPVAGVFVRSVSSQSIDAPPSPVGAF